MINVASLHRLHLLDRFDHAYVLNNGNNGKVVEEGPFADLLAAKGTLFDLWQAQKREEE
jgi:ABC-type multidrug transport system fused ATPase/permease subunit